MHHRSDGFTLIELMIVIVLIGILLGMVSLAMGQNPARQAGQEASNIVSLIHHLRERAVLDGLDYGVRLSADGYRGMRLAGQGWESITLFYPWPDNLRMHLELDGGISSLGADDGPPQLLMLSSDETSVFTLTFMTADTTWLSLSSDGIGEVLIDG
jgi:general secretion pathway protein H